MPVEHVAPTDDDEELIPLVSTADGGGDWDCRDAMAVGGGPPRGAELLAGGEHSCGCS